MKIIGKYSAEKSKRRVDKEEKVGPDKKDDPYPWLTGAKTPSIFHY